MASSINPGPDDTSIKPVSSLRSRFENLAKDSAPTVPAKPAVLVKTLHSRNGTVQEADVHGGSAPGEHVHTLRNGFSRPTTPTHAIKGQSSVEQLAHSTVPTVRLRVAPLSRPSLLVVAVSPKLLPTQSSMILPTHTHITPQRTSDSNGSSHGHTRMSSRAATPVLESSKISREVTSDPSKKSQVALPAAEVKNEQANPEAKKSAGPPTVNRAAKPKVPVKPSPLTLQPKKVSTPDYRLQMAEQFPSPFVTPPGSGASSPELTKTRSRQDSASQERVQYESKQSMVERARTGSDASWVQRIRTDSDLSSVARDRAGSSASFVETSELPDNWLPPPVHHAVAERRERRANGTGRSTYASQMSTSPTRNLGDGHDDAEAPRLPARPELQMRHGRTSAPKSFSGRSSPTKLSLLNPQRSNDAVNRSRTPPEPLPSRRSATTLNDSKSALHSGFSQSTPNLPPAIPAPRRSGDRRRDVVQPLQAITPEPARVTNDRQRFERDDTPTESSTLVERGNIAAEFPDGTQSNRRPPRYKQRPWQIPTGYDTKLLAVCGDHVCTSGFITKVWNMRTGEQLLMREHREGVKVLSVVFVPMPDMQDEGSRIWLGTNIGEIQDLDILSQRVEKTNADAHTRREVSRIFRHGHEIWSLDDGGDLNVWKADRNRSISLSSSPVHFRVQRGHTFALACGPQLWVANGKEIRVYIPGARSDAEFTVTRSPLTQTAAGEITAGAMLHSSHELVFFGHSDGKVSVYDAKKFTCTAVVNVSLYRISSLEAVADYLWAGYSTGMTYVYDTSTSPWTIRKDWQAHEKQVCAITADPSAIWTMGRLNVVTLSTDNNIRIWDGMLGDDLLDAQMRAHDSEYCSFRELNVAVMTWNAGASKPDHLRFDKEDNNFFREYLQNSSDAHVLVFGFQELVDLEDKKLTAKSLFKSKKKDPYEQEHMSHQYRAWRDHLSRCVDEYLSSRDSYVLLHTASLVGLFTCVFVRASERNRIKHVHTNEVKCGMGGRYGNKGALIVRMIIDDSSVCLVNCHLAAGQTHTVHRNNDIANILEASGLPTYPLNESDGAQHSDVFSGGGDGSMILDHEMCILNGDLNYRIDTMGRDAVVKQVQQGNLTRLLERDQLLLSRRKNPGFRLRAFHESTITFAPTYKYNVHTDEYDTSEKKRAPAWCDRILYRGIGRVKMEEYRRWDGIRVSDHRPVSGKLTVRVKLVDAARREAVWQRCLAELNEVKDRVTRAAQLEYLTNVMGMPYKKSLEALQQSARLV